jgi:hypothetical protein
VVWLPLWLGCLSFTLRRHGLWPFCGIFYAKKERWANFAQRSQNGSD